MIAVHRLTGTLGNPETGQSIAAGSRNSLQRVVTRLMREQEAGKKLSFSRRNERLAKRWKRGPFNEIGREAEVSLSVSGADINAITTRKRTANRVSPAARIIPLASIPAAG